MRTTTRTKNKIKKFEGLRLKAYVCAAGVCTIGYGHTTGVKPGDVITEARADAFFESDIRAVENQVNALPLNLGQYQFDAVVSFCFNVGIGKFKQSTLYKKIRADLREGLRMIHPYRQSSKSGYTGAVRFFRGLLPAVNGRRNVIRD